MKQGISWMFHSIQTSFSQLSIWHFPYAPSIHFKWVLSLWKKLVQSCFLYRLVSQAHSICLKNAFKNASIFMKEGNWQNVEVHYLCFHSYTRKHFYPHSLESTPPSPSVPSPPHFVLSRSVSQLNGYIFFNSSIFLKDVSWKMVSPYFFLRGKYRALSLYLHRYIWQCFVSM